MSAPSGLLKGSIGERRPAREPPEVHKQGGVLRLKIHLVRGARMGFQRSLAQAEQWLTQVNVIWAQAGIRLEAVAWSQPIVSDELLANAQSSAAELTRLAVYDPALVNLFWVHNISNANQLSSLCQLWKEQRMLMVAERYYSDPPVRNLARGIAVLLGLPLSHGTSSGLLATHHCLGTTLTATQIERAQQERASLAGEVAPATPKAAARKLVEIKIPGGSIVLHTLPETEFVGLTIRVARVAQECKLWLTLAELNQCVDALQLADSTDIIVGSLTLLGQLVPQSALLRILLSRPPEGDMEVLLDFESAGSRTAFPLNPAAARQLALCLQEAAASVQVSAAYQPRTTSLAQSPLLAVPDFCQIYGPDQEVLSLHDLTPQDELLVWPWRGQEVLRIQALRAAHSNAALLSRAQACTDPQERLTCLCALGQRADRLQAHGQIDLAEVLYGGVNNVLFANRQVQGYLLSKLTLGIMLLRARQLDGPAAYDIWMKEPPDMPFGVGVDGLERAHVSQRDYCIYKLLCAWLYSLGPTPAVALQRLNETMDSLCQIAPGDLQASALDHWRIHLDHLFAGQPIPDDAAALYHQHRGPAQSAPTASLVFPAPDRWEIPT